MPKTCRFDLVSATHRQSRQDCLNTMAGLIYMDAMAHELYEEYRDMTLVEARKRLAARIGTEVFEMVQAAEDQEHYAEELADVIIMALSVGAYLGVDVGKAVQDKRIRNIMRSVGHAERDV